MFALSSVLVNSFAWKGAPANSSIVASATLWIVIFFSSILVLTTSFAREVDRGTIDGLRSLPCPPYAILFGKILYGVAVLSIVVAVTSVSSVVFLGLQAETLPLMMLILALGTLDLAMVGSMISALVMYSEGKTLLLSYLFFPVSVPILVPSSLATEKIISGMGIVEVVAELRLLLALLLAVTAGSIILFRNVFEE